VQCNINGALHHAILPQQPRSRCKPNQKAPPTPSGTATAFLCVIGQAIQILSSPHDDAWSSSMVAFGISIKILAVLYSVIPGLISITGNLSSFETASDRANEREIANMGWKSLTVWECEFRSPDAVKRKVTLFLGAN
jgi:hypothetical protein